MKDRIKIEKSLIPYTFSMMFGDELFTVNVDYNATGDFFTIGLTNADGDVVTRGDKIVYDMPLFGDIFDPKVFPVITITPCDPSKAESIVNWDTFMETVFLCIDNEEEEDE